MIEQSIDSVQRLAALRPRVAYSGHGPAISDPSAAFASALRRLERWRTDPQAAAWHAAKRILAFALMIEGGIAVDALDTYLASSPWLQAFATRPFNTNASAFAAGLLQEMLRSKAAVWRDDHLVANAPHTLTSPAWPQSPTIPEQWPPALSSGV